MNENQKILFTGGGIVVIMIVIILALMSITTVSGADT